MQDDFDNGMGLPDDELPVGSAAAESGEAGGTEAEAEHGQPAGRTSGGARARKSSSGRKSGGARKAAAKSGAGNRKAASKSRAGAKKKGGARKASKGAKKKGGARKAGRKK